MSSTSSLVAPVDPTGRRKGLIAAQNLLAGTVIPGEEPIFAIPLEPMLSFLEKDPLSFLASLSHEKLMEFIAIPPSPDIPRNLIFSRIVQMVPTSSLSSVDMKTGGLVFLHLPLFGKAKHSCVPNAKLCIQKGKKIGLRIIRHIPQGSQILIDYVGGNFPCPFEPRQSITEKLLRFECSCPACRRPPVERKVLEAKLNRVVDLMQQFDSRGGIKGLLHQGGLQAIRAFFQSLVDLIVVVVEELFLHSALLYLLRLTAWIASLFFGSVCALEWIGLYNRYGRIQGQGKGQFSDPEDEGLKSIYPPQQLRDLVTSLTTRPSTFLLPPAPVAASSSKPTEPSPPPNSSSRASSGASSSSSGASHVEKIVGRGGKSIYSKETVAPIVASSKVVTSPVDPSKIMSSKEIEVAVVQSKLVSGEEASADLSSLPPLPPSPATPNTSSPSLTATQNEYEAPLVPHLRPLPLPLQPPGLAKAQASSPTVVASKEGSVV
ncbi:hypothetical protein BDY24DRAFT_443592 [Mrakia frigida]|uniref:uncharacterized protein n=1 Tax=Mrakia frigida TaxID=29902 RepID=UPI003FCBEF01